MNRELLIIALIVFVTSLFTRSVDPVVPLIADGLTVQIGTAALLSTAFALPYAVIQPVFGALADMMSKTRLMSICLVILVLSALVSATAPDFTVLMLSRVAAGLASGGIFPTSLATVGDRIPVAQRQVAISRLLAATMTGNLLGASLAGVVGDLAGWRAVFVVVGMLGLIAMVTALIGFRKLTPPPPAGFDLSTIGPNYRAIFANPNAKICFGAVFVESLVVFGIFPYMAALLAEAGETRSSIAGFVLAGFGVGAVVYTMFVRSLLHLVGEKRLMLGGGLIMAAFLLILTLRLPWPLRIRKLHDAGLRLLLAAWQHPGLRHRACAAGPRLGDGAALGVVLSGAGGRPDRLWRGLRHDRKDAAAGLRRRRHRAGRLALLTDAAPRAGDDDLTGTPSLENVSAPPAIGRDSLLGHPDALGQLAGLPEHVDRHAAARIPIAADPHPARLQQRVQALADRDGAALVEGAVISEGIQIELQRLRLDQELVRNIVDDEMREVRLAGDRAERGEFRHREARHVMGVRMRVRHPVENGGIGGGRNGGRAAELQLGLALGFPLD